MRISSAESCRYACVSLGEVMLRLDPGEGRVQTARRFNVWEGGGEYNVARGLRRCFGLRTAIVTAFVDNPVGRLIEDLILQGGVDTQFVLWKPFDGIGRTARNGLNFTERGFGIRAAQGTSDRGHTAASQMKPDDVDWDTLFGQTGVQWFHTGGIFAGLSETTPEVVVTAMQAAKRHGTIVSYDLNYRPSLWKGLGGIDRCQQVNRRIAPLVDVLIGNEEDFSACLGFQIEGANTNLSALNVQSYKAMIGRVVAKYPNIRTAATTLRNAITATKNEWNAVLWAEDRFYEPTRSFCGDQALEILDRVGGGDSFASGLIYGFLKYNDPAKAVDYACVHGALAMTTPGDTSMASLAEVENIVRGANARIER